MIIVDSSVWIDFFNGIESQVTDKLDKLLGVAQLGIGDLILTEVLQGFKIDKDYKVAKEHLLAFTVCDMLGKDAAILAAENYRALRKKGITIRKTNDVVIASYCIRHGHSLLFSDKDFIPFVKHLGLKDALTDT